MPRLAAGDTAWYCIRRSGVAQRHGWIDGPMPAALRTDVGALPDETVELCSECRFRTVEKGRFARKFTHRARGVIGMEIAFRGDVARFAPTQMLAANLGFGRALEKYCAKNATDKGEVLDRGRLRAFSARQFLLPGGNDTKPVELVRGSMPVDPGPSPGEDRAAVLADGIGRWMLRNLSSDGAIPYKYWPSRGACSPADNAIRRFLGSLALARLAELRDCAELREAGRRNLRFNLNRYFRNIGNGRGAIVEGAEAKLGAAAIAGLAIMANSAGAEFLEKLTMLAAGIASLEDDEFGFRTFFFPGERDGENWNFYSGEALLFWAEAARRGLPFAPSLKHCTNVFERCRARHLRKRNPAFVPWHTQACASLFAQTGRRAFADFAFEMNDWLLPMQQWRGLPPDMRGRFYDPRRPDFGPPHAASTGAYLEGLADAAALARALDNRNRATAYERALDRGLRSLRQLQFRDWRDTFYISKPERVLGALRTEVYDNAVRVDSAAHALLAAVKVLRPIDFGAAGPG
ncbi:MAG: hypothetical protein OXM58_11100 [Rhodospirillaceae bacterium]|nr:hypothetical protein [Rhodospirillaceae bacterium]MDE0618478.1 hypothetical protein [Rhodospirillaceae bacterium]